MSNDKNKKYENPIYLTQNELAERWSVSPRSLEQARYHNSGVQYLKVGSRVRYPLSAVEKYEREHMFTNTTQYPKKGQ